MRLHLHYWLGVAALLAVGGCAPQATEAPSTPARPGGPQVVATIAPLAAVARELGGDRFAVHALLPPGASAHTFELSPQAARAVAEARLVLRVGPGLDDWLDALLTSSRARTVTALEVTDPIMAAAHERHEGEQSETHEAETEAAPDPHVWLDPIRMRDDLAPAIAEALAAVEPSEATAIDQRLKAFQERLTALDSEIRGQLAALTNRKYIAAHAAWAYFNARYDLVQVAVIEPQPGQEPSAQWLKEVVDVAREQGATAVFGEVQLNQSLGRIIEREAKLRFGLLDPQGGVPGRDRYETLLRYNAGQFAEVLGHE